MIRGMKFVLILYCCFFLWCYLSLVFATPEGQKNEAAKSKLKDFKCPDDTCHSDNAGYSAIMELHGQIDDDRDGTLDREESNEFIRDELKHSDEQMKQRKFHGTDDKITTDDLWYMWTRSPVYNWTLDETLDWLELHVGLPQYRQNFRDNDIRGRDMPRLATNSVFVSTILRIRSGVHRQKLALKAMDAILFGAPTRHSIVKDAILVGALVLAVIGCWFAVLQRRTSQTQLKKVMNDLQTLQRAEDALKDTQKKLDETEEEHKQALIQQQEELEKQIRNEVEEARKEAARLRQARSSTESEMSRLKLAEQELEQMRTLLLNAESELQRAHAQPLGELQNWLQLCYELESLHYDVKREAAERQLHAAKDMCEKIRRKRSTFLGSIRIAHTTNIDDTDQQIVAARQSLEEIKQDVQERVHRWRQIEKVCGFCVMVNPGLVYLESVLRSAGQYPFLGHGSISGSMPAVAPINADDADVEDLPASYIQAATQQSCNNHSRFRQPRGTLGAMATSHSLSCSQTTSLGSRGHIMQAGMQLTMLGFGLSRDSPASTPLLRNSALSSLKNVSSSARLTDALRTPISGSVDNVLSNGEDSASLPGSSAPSTAPSSLKTDVEFNLNEPKEPILYHEPEMTSRQSSAPTTSTNHRQMPPSQSDGAISNIRARAQAASASLSQSNRHTSSQEEMDMDSISLNSNSSRKKLKDFKFFRKVMRPSKRKDT